jgi:hypothetical protein
MIRGGVFQRRLRSKERHSLQSCDEFGCVNERSFALGQWFGAQFACHLNTAIG